MGFAALALLCQIVKVNSVYALYIPVTRLIRRNQFSNNFVIILLLSRKSYMPVEMRYCHRHRTTTRLTSIPRVHPPTLPPGKVFRQSACSVSPSSWQRAPPHLPASPPSPRPPTPSDLATVQCSTCTLRGRVRPSPPMHRPGKSKWKLQQPKD